jgi:hypothetical protein
LGFRVWDAPGIPKNVPGAHSTRNAQTDTKPYRFSG